EGWMFAIPVVEYSEEASVKIYDVSGRMIWSGHAESGSVLHWDGYTADRTPVPNGVYLLQCSIGSEVSTGSFVVRRN
ncbi:MAG: T9SS type A sorting domain-containing protein, partial [Candidatus Aegiribacteria sp.]|nr:T9SS type A sorting domain-containing protein [Candidatus Aegiribacteria sp.]